MKYPRGIPMVLKSANLNDLLDLYGCMNGGGGVKRAV